MVVNSVLNGLSPSYGLRSGDNSQTARPAGPAKNLPGKSFAAEVDAARDASATNSNAIDVGQTQSALERARQQPQATSESLKGETSESSGGRPAPGIALYERISQYDNGEPSTSTLLKSWNEIMQGAQDTEGAAAAFTKTLAQNETLGLRPGILDLTA
jgi:hypothetical protein